MKSSITAFLLVLASVLLFCVGCKEQAPNSPAQAGAGNNSSAASGHPSRDATNNNSAADSSAAVGAVDRIPLDDVVGGEVSLARNFYIVFDASGSMGGDKIVQAKQAMETVIGTLPEDYNLGLYIFDGSGSSERVPLGPNNHQRVRSAIRSVQANGTTPLGTAVQSGVQRLVEQYKQQLGYGEFRLIVVTDGEADQGNTPDRAAREAQRLGIPIYTIGFQVRGHSLQQYSVFFTTANDTAELQRGLGQVFGELESFDPASFEGP
jgi:Mg-chelatase subunit ChlD